MKNFFGNRTAIQSVIFLDEYPLCERYSFLKRYKLSPISKCNTQGNQHIYCIIDTNEFRKLTTHKIKSFSNDGHTRYIELIVGWY